MGNSITNNDFLIISMVYFVLALLTQKHFRKFSKNIQNLILVGEFMAHVEILQKSFKQRQKMNLNVCFINHYKLKLSENFTMQPTACVRTLKGPAFRSERMSTSFSTYSISVI